MTKVIRSDYRGSPPTGNDVCEYVAFAELNLDERNLFFLIYKNKAHAESWVPDDIIIGRLDDIESLDISGFSDFRVDEETCGVVIGGKVFGPDELLKHAANCGCVKSLMGGWVECDADLLKAAEAAGITVDDDLKKKVTRITPPNSQNLLELQATFENGKKVSKINLYLSLVMIGMIVVASILNFWL